MAGRMLKSTTAWDNFGCCFDTYSFSALPAGSKAYYGKYESAGDYAFFWSSTESDEDGLAYYMSMYEDNPIVSVESSIKGYGFSVRCIKGDFVEKSSFSVALSSSSMSSVIPGSLTGNLLTDSRDGRSYKTVVIGSQTWMAENLNYETANSYCYNDSTKYCEKFGRLYTWAAAMDSVGAWSTNGKGCGYVSTCSPTYPVRGVCPIGWHLPTRAEFETLFTAVGKQTIAGTKLKSTSDWKNRNDGASGNGTDDYSFSALPTGYRTINGIYSNREGNFAHFWSSTVHNSYYVYDMCLIYDSVNAYLNLEYKVNGFSVRCVKD